MDLNEISVFVTVVKTGSFSGAARSLGMPNSTVSAKVSSLEKRLGVTLLTRTTRKLAVTDAGEAYYRLCTPGLEQLRAAETAVTIGQTEPTGHLKVTAPVEMGSIVLPTVVARFQQRFPKVSLEFELTDRRVDLLGEGFDLAIRAGELADSTLMAKKLGSVYFTPFASKKYLAQRGTPKTPKDLLGHNCLQFTPLGDEWQLVSAKGRAKIKIPSMAKANDLSMVKSMAISGVGIALLPTFFCYQDVGSGALERLLPDWRTASSPAHFVYPAQKFLPPKLSAFFEVATDLLKKSFESYEL